jgi:hypothetical protein
MNLSRAGFMNKLNRIKIRPGLFFGILIITALIAFEMFNYSTTDFALRDLLGDLRFAGILWSTILAIAFCGIDFAGIARLFTPQTGNEEPKEVWYLFGAWLLAATMNALLTWWGVSMAITNHVVQSTSVVDPKTMTTVIPIFVAIMVWVIRILIIGSISVSGERLFSSDYRRPVTSTSSSSVRPFTRPTQSQEEKSAPAPLLTPRPSITRPSMSADSARSSEPTYHSMSMSGRSGSSSNRQA